MQIDFYYRTFGELKANKDLGFEDPEGIMASLNLKMREALLCNPSGYKDDETCQILALDGINVVGACNAFQGRMRAKGKVLSVQNGSYLFAHEDYRKENVGGELFVRISKIHPNRDNLFAGISQMALGLYKALKYTIFQFPRLIYLRKSRSVIHTLLKTESPIVTPIIWIADSLLFVHRILLKGTVAILTHGYSIERVDKTPEDVEFIVLSDEHPYAELHDKQWFDWNLNQSFCDNKQIKKKLYIIRREGKIVAFFLTKQEFFEKASSRGFKNVYLGSVVEWGVLKDSRLTETDIYLMSIGCFDKNVDGIQVASSDMKTISRLKKYLFVSIGFANMGFKLKSIKDADVKTISNWRVRIAASDTSMN